MSDLLRSISGIGAFLPPPNRNLLSRQDLLLLLDVCEREQVRLNKVIRNIELDQADFFIGERVEEDTDEDKPIIEEEELQEEDDLAKCEEELEEAQERIRELEAEQGEIILESNDVLDRLEEEVSQLEEDKERFKEDVAKSSAIQEELNIKVIKMNEVIQKGKNKPLQSLIDRTRNSAGFTDEKIKKWRKDIKDNEIEEKELQNEDDKGNEFNIRTFIRPVNKRIMVKGIKTLINNKQIKVINGDIGEELVIEYIEKVFLPAFKYSDDRINKIYKADRKRRGVDRLGKKIIEHLLKRNNILFDDSKGVGVLRKLLKDSVNTREEKIHYILQPDSSHAYEDIRWFNGNPDSELLIDVKVAQGGELSGNLLSLTKALKFYDRPLWYIKIDWNANRQGIIVVSKVSIISNRLFKFEDFEVYSDNQYKHNGQKNRTKIIDNNSQRKAYYISGIKSLGKNSMMKSYTSFKNQLIKIKDIQ